MGCAMECDKKSDCVFFAIVNTAFYDGWGPTNCYLKSICGNKIYATGKMSYYKDLAETGIFTAFVKLQNIQYCFYIGIKFY